MGTAGDSAVHGPRYLKHWDYGPTVYKDHARIFVSTVGTLRGTQRVYSRYGFRAVPTVALKDDDTMPQKYPLGCKIRGPYEAESCLI